MADLKVITLTEKIQDFLDGKGSLEPFPDQLLHHNRLELLYELEYLKELNLENVSIGIINQTQKLCGVFMAWKRGKVIDFLGRQATVYLNGNLGQQKKAAELIADVIKSELKKDSELIIKVKHHPFLSSELLSQAKIKYITELLVDLSLDEDAIMQSIRKSYRSLINWGKKNLQLTLVNHVNASSEQFYAYKNFHLQVAGKKTRSDRSWDLQFELLKAGRAFMVLGHLEGKLVSGNFVIHDEQEALYGVGVYDRDLMAENKPLAHWPLLYSILEAKKLGLKTFKLGIIEDASNEKVKNIELFKKGFSTSVNIQNYLEISPVTTNQV